MISNGRSEWGSRPVILQGSLWTCSINPPVTKDAGQPVGGLLHRAQEEMLLGTAYRQERLRLWVGTWSPLHRLKNFQKEEESGEPGPMGGVSIVTFCLPLLKEESFDGVGSGEKEMGSSSSEVVKQRLATPWQMGCRGDSRVSSGIKICKLLREDFWIHGYRGLGFKVIFGATDLPLPTSQTVSFWSQWAGTVSLSCWGGELEDLWAADLPWGTWSNKHLDN